MAINHTPHFQLNQWNPDDPVLRDDFNADNMRLESALHTLTSAVQTAGNAQLEHSTYVGSGGSSVSLTFRRRPCAVLVTGYDSLLVPGLPAIGHVFHTAPGDPVQFRWSDNTVNWDTPAPQLWANEKGHTYHYYALYSSSL